VRGKILLGCAAIIGTCISVMYNVDRKQEKNFVQKVDTLKMERDTLHDKLMGHCLSDNKDWSDETCKALVIREHDITIILNWVDGGV
jgi:hypothetical protein